MARPSIQKKYLMDKYREITWALSLQDYSNEQIGVIMNRHRSVINRLIDARPKDHVVKWVKVK